jgi:hypothetical protein
MLLARRGGAGDVGRAHHDRARRQAGSLSLRPMGYAVAPAQGSTR